ncbi:MAG: hypothetical protein JNK15_10250 [Planctomycetes bacterium]|nr:hypothetical protein [Planctomycetota bacterium]
MTKHTVMAWNARHILVEHVRVDRSTDQCDPVMSAVHRLQRALGAKDDDPRWQAWEGDAGVEVLSVQTTAQNVDDLLERLNRVPALEAEVAAMRSERDAARTSFAELVRRVQGETGAFAKWREIDADDISDNADDVVADHNKMLGALLVLRRLVLGKAAWQERLGDDGAAPAVGGAS